MFPFPEEMCDVVEKSLMWQEKIIFPHQFSCSMLFKSGTFTGLLFVSCATDPAVRLPGWWLFDYVSADKALFSFVPLHRIVPALTGRQALHFFTLKTTISSIVRRRARYTILDKTRLESGQTLALVVPVEAYCCCCELHWCVHRSTS